MACSSREARSRAGVGVTDALGRGNSRMGDIKAIVHDNQDHRCQRATNMGLTSLPGILHDLPTHSFDHSFDHKPPNSSQTAASSGTCRRATPRAPYEAFQEYSVLPIVVLLRRLRRSSAPGPTTEMRDGHYELGNRSEQIRTTIVTSSRLAIYLRSPLATLVASEDA